MTIENREDVQRLIKSAAALQGFTITDIAERIGIAPPTLNRAINHSDMRLSMLLRIASALGLRLDVRFTADGSGTASGSADHGTFGE